jgi:uncharacterized protein YukE
MAALKFKKLKTVSEMNARHLELINEKNDLKKSREADERTFSELIINGENTESIERKIEKSRVRERAINAALRELENAIAPLSKKERLEKIVAEHETRMKQFDAAVPELVKLYEQVSAATRDIHLARSRGEGANDLERGTFAYQLFEYVSRLSRPVYKPSRVEPTAAELAFLRAGRES